MPHPFFKKKHADIIYASSFFRKIYLYENIIIFKHIFKIIKYVYMKI